MLLEYIERRYGLGNKEFNEIVEQNLNKEMTTNRKTMFEVAKERGEIRGKIKTARLTVLRSKCRDYLLMRPL